MDDQLPSNIIFEIFSRVPVKSLVRFRCVSKQWREYIDDSYLRIIHHGLYVEEPTPIIFRQVLNTLGLLTLYIHLTESEQSNIHDHHVVKQKKTPVFKVASSDVLQVHGCCKGLLYFSKLVHKTKLFVIHPLKNELYELPVLPNPLSFVFAEKGESCGLGFDAATQNFMMCVSFKNRCTMVHVFGTNTWREIPKVPSYAAFGAGVFAQGCLYWLVGYHKNARNVGREVVWFDVTQEEFGLIKTPKTIGVHYYNDHFVDIAGEVGLVCNNPNRRIDIWILKQKEWVSHCSFDINYDHLDRGIKVLGCWNKEGDILISIAVNKKGWFFVYRLKSGELNRLDEFDESIIMLYYDNIICHQHKLPFNMIKIEGKMSL